MRNERKKMNNKNYTIIFCLLFMFFICNSAFARPFAREKACFSNIRVIQGAVEMYNMDNDIKMENLNIENLQKGYYLKGKPDKPETSCEYKSIGDLSKEGEGIVFCTYHGDVEHLVYAEFNKEFNSNQYEKLPQNATNEDVKANIGRIKKGKDLIQFKKNLNKYGILIGIPISIILFNLLLFLVIKGKKKAKQ